MKKSEQKIWTKAELTIAYYIAKWDLNGLNASMEDLALCVIEDTTVRSLEMQAANFRHILGIEGYNLEHFSKAQDEVATELQNKTVTQVRKIITTMIEASDVKIECLENRKVNTKINEIKDKANAESQEVFENKLASLRKHRNLRKL